MARLIIKYRCTHLKIIPSAPKRSLWNRLSHTSSKSLAPAPHSAGNRGFVVERDCDECLALREGEVVWDASVSVGEGVSLGAGEESGFRKDEGRREVLGGDGDGDIGSLRLGVDSRFGVGADIDLDLDPLPPSDSELLHANDSRSHTIDEEASPSSPSSSNSNTTLDLDLNLNLNLNLPPQAALTLPLPPSPPTAYLWTPNSPSLPPRTLSEEIWHYPVSTAEANAIWDLTQEVVFPPGASLWPGKDFEASDWSSSSSSSSSSDGEEEEDDEEEPVSISDRIYRELALSSRPAAPEPAQLRPEIKIPLQQQATSRPFIRPLPSQPPRLSRLLPKYRLWHIINDAGYEHEADFLSTQLKQRADRARVQVRRASFRAQQHSSVVDTESVTDGILGLYDDEGGDEEVIVESEAVVDDDEPAMVYRETGLVVWKGRHSAWKPSPLRIEARVF